MTEFPDMPDDPFLDMPADPFVDDRERKYFTWWFEWFDDPERILRDRDAWEEDDRDPQPWPHALAIPEVIYMMGQDYEEGIGWDVWLRDRLYEAIRAWAFRRDGTKPW